MGVNLNFLKVRKLLFEEIKQFSIYQFKPTEKHVWCPDPDSNPKDKALLLHYLICSNQVFSWTM